VTNEENKQPDGAPAATVSDDAKLPYFSDPRFQTIYREWCASMELISEMTLIFSECRYSIKSVATLKLILEDAFALYDVANGKTAGSALLASIERGAEPEVFSALVVNLTQFLAPRLEKFLRETADPALDDAAKLRALDLLASVRELGDAQRRAEIPHEQENPCSKGVN